MRYIITTLLALLSIASYGQGTVPFGATRIQDTAYTKGGLKADSDVRFTKYGTSDTTKVFGIAPNGLLVLRPGGAAPADTNLWVKVNGQVLPKQDTVGMKQKSLYFNDPDQSVGYLFNISPLTGSLNIDDNNGINLATLSTFGDMSVSGAFGANTISVGHNIFASGMLSTSAPISGYVTKITSNGELATQATIPISNITGAVPATRAITINGTSQDLSTDRTYSVGTVTSLAVTGTNGLSVTGSPITTNGTIAIGLDTSTASTGVANKGYVNNANLLNAKYGDSVSTFPTKAFLLNNYLRQGLNSFGVAGKIGTADNNDFQIWTNNTQKATISALGEFMINTNTPIGGLFKLNVNGDIFSNDLTTTNVTATGAISGFSFRNLNGVNNGIITLGTATTSNSVGRSIADAVTVWQFKQNSSSATGNFWDCINSSSVNLAHIDINGYLTSQAPAYTSGSYSLVVHNTTSNRQETIAVLTTTATLNFPSTAGGTSSDLTVTLTGAAVGDGVVLGVPVGSVTANSSYPTPWVSAANTVTVRFLNSDPINPADPASGTFKISIIKL